MHRLFWKYFSGFFLAQILAIVTAVAFFFWFNDLQAIQLSNLFSNLHAFQILASSCVINALIALVMAWRFTRPIQQLSSAIKLAAQGDLNHLLADADQAHKRELTELTQAFDEMLARVKQLILGQTRMLHHVSHELRSPLARLQMATGLAMQDHKKMDSALQRIELEAIRMDNMIAELLEVSRLETGMVKLVKANVDIGEMLTSIVTDAEFEQTQIVIQLNMPTLSDATQAVYLQGQHDLLYRAIENVVRNAVKYSPEQGVVNVDLLVSKKTREMVIEVQDQGAGVSESELETIFLPFVRAKGTSHIEGHGVGLAITKHIVEAHGGYVTAANLNPKGFMVRLHFPI